jgi:hypothetical protein
MHFLMGICLQVNKLEIFISARHLVEFTLWWCELGLASLLCLSVQCFGKVPFKVSFVLHVAAEMFGHHVSTHLDHIFGSNLVFFLCFFSFGY